MSVGERLFKDSLKKKERIGQLADKIIKDQCTFKPKISEYTKKIINKMEARGFESSQKKPSSIQKQPKEPEINLDNELVFNADDKENFMINHSFGEINIPGPSSKSKSHVQTIEYQPEMEFLVKKIDQIHASSAGKEAPVKEEKKPKASQAKEKAKTKKT